MTTLLVIGGSGFFGKSILDAHKRGLLNSLGIKKIIIYSRTAENLRFVAPDLLDNSISLTNGDITTARELPFCHKIIHAASSTNALDYINSSQREFFNIVDGVENFCNILRAQKFKPDVLYVSSGAIYGKQGSGAAYIKEGDPFESIDDMALNKQDYARAKRICEEKMIGFAAEGNSVSIARCFSFVGKYLPRHLHFAIGNFISDGLLSRPISVEAKSVVYRSYMYADDLVEWLLQLINFSSENCPIVNVGSDQRIDIHSLAEKVANYFSVPFCKPFIGEQISDSYVPSIDRAKELGLKLKFDIDNSIHQTVLAIQNHSGMSL
jgi:dTDP-glucose 4,6-dehydratase